MTCGDRKEGTKFVVTGPSKGHYPVFVCDQNDDHRGKHKDSQASVTWH
jgi:hypothetical protein